MIVLVLVPSFAVQLFSKAKLEIRLLRTRFWPNYLIISLTEWDRDLILVSAPTKLMVLHILVPSFASLLLSKKKLEIFPRCHGAPT